MTPRKLKIGLDAKRFFKGPVSNRIVIRQLIEQLIYEFPQHELFLFIDKQSQTEPFPYQQPHVHVTYVWAGNNQLSNLFIVSSEANRLGLDVVVFQNFAPFYGRFKKITYIHDVLFISNPEFYSWKERLYFAPLKMLARQSDRICTISQSEKKRLLAYRFKKTAEDIDVIYHGVDPRFRPAEAYDPGFLQTFREQYKLPDRYLLYVGRLNIRKNILNLLKSLPLLTDRHIPLVIVGAKDWKMPSLDETIKELSLSDRLIFTGHVPDEDLPVFFALAQVFCFPSFAEGFGLPPLEAMAAGVPVVVSDRTSLPEVCGEAGNYANPDDAHSIANAINTLLTDPSFFASKRELGLKRAKLFTWKKAASELVQSIFVTLQS